MSKSSEGKEGSIFLYSSRSEQLTLLFNKINAQCCELKDVTVRQHIEGSTHYICVKYCGTPYTLHISVPFDAVNVGFCTYLRKRIDGPFSQIISVNFSNTKKYSSHNEIITGLAELKRVIEAQMCSCIDD